MTKLLVDVGTAAAEYSDQHVRSVKARCVQCDEVWSFVGAKKKNTTPGQRHDGMGDAWTWVALDADTKLCISYLVGGRDGGRAWDLMQDVAGRIKGRVQLATDGCKPYLEAVEGAFGADVDSAPWARKVPGATARQSAFAAT